MSGMLENRADEVLRKAKRAGAYQGAMNCMAAHLYSYRAQAQQNEVDNYWSSRHDEISYWNNDGYEAIKDFFCVKNGQEMRDKKLTIINKYYPEIEVCPENDGMGDMVAKGAVSAYVIPAEDGESAKGLWLTPGICSEVNLDGRPKGTYMHEKVGLNVVREPDGSWKILKLRTYVEFVTPIPTEWLEMESEAGERTFSLAPEAESHENPPEPAYGKKPYSITTKAGYYPPLPVPYESWSEENAMVKY